MRGKKEIVQLINSITPEFNRLKDSCKDGRIEPEADWKLYNELGTILETLTWVIGESQ